MRIENMIQYIVPLTLMAIWALTSLFNRESQSLPPRTARTPGPGQGGANRSGIGPQTTRTYSTPRPTAQPYEPARRTGTGASRSTDDDIVILEDNNRRPGAQIHRITAPSARRTNRARAASQPAKPARPDHAQTLELSGKIVQSIASEVAQPRTLSPLSLPSSPLLSPTTSDVGKQSLLAATLPTEGFNPIDFRTLIGSQVRLRESLIMSEILQPPLAMRPRGGRRF